eukprot:164220_1
MDQLISKTQIECGKYFLNNCASTNTYSKCIEACLNQQTYKNWNNLSRLDSKWSHKIESNCIDDNKNSIQINFDFDENDSLCFLYLDNYQKNIIKKQRGVNCVKDIKLDCDEYYNPQIDLMEYSYLTYAAGLSICIAAIG